eukprot:scaffold77814_cov67-Phaeocystis_antarctica.AAC.18
MSPPIPHLRQRPRQHPSRGCTRIRVPQRPRQLALAHALLRRAPLEAEASEWAAAAAQHLPNQRVYRASRKLRRCRGSCGRRA